MDLILICADVVAQKHQVFFSLLKLAFAIKPEQLVVFLHDFLPPVFCCLHSLILHPTLSRGTSKVFEGESQSQAARTWTRPEGAEPADVIA